MITGVCKTLGVIIVIWMLKTFDSSALHQINKDMKIKSLLEAINTVSAEEMQKIHSIALAVRKHYEGYYEDEPYWSVSSCHHAAQELAKKLNDAGLSAKAVMGVYKDVDDEYPEIVAKHRDWDSDNDINDFDGTWKHWWVEYKDKIIDITADQFHPKEQAEYRLVITDINDPIYN